MQVKPKIPNKPLDKKECPYTYLIGWRSLDLWYYGVRYAKGCSPADLWVDYFTSSKRVAEIRREHGESDVVVVRKVFADPNSATAWESRFLQRVGAVRSERWLNMARAGTEFNTSSPEIRAKISAAKMGHVTTEETRKRIGDGRRGKPMPETAKAKLSIANKGKRFTQEHRDKISSGRKGIVFSEETRARMRAAQLGKKQSPETIAKRKASILKRRQENG